MWPFDVIDQRGWSHVAAAISTWPIRWFAAPDLFISYKRNEARNYAVALINRLNQGRNISCAIDRLEARPGRMTHERVLRHARWSRARVVLATPAAMDSIEIARELEQTERYPGPMVVIAQPDVDLGLAIWHKHIEGIDPFWEKGGMAAFDEGAPSDEVVEHTQSIMAFMLRERRNTIGVAIGASLTVLGLSAAVLFGERAGSAEARATRALASADRASQAASVAASQAQSATARRVQAEAAASAAEDRLSLTTGRLSVVSEELVVAERRSTALRLSAAAWRLRQERDARWNASKPSQDEDRDPSVLTEVFALATESERLSPNAVAEELLRDGISLLALPIWHRDLPRRDDVVLDVDRSGRFAAVATRSRNEDKGRVAVFDLRLGAEAFSLNWPRALCDLLFVGSDVLGLRECEGRRTAVQFVDIAKAIPSNAINLGPRPRLAGPHRMVELPEGVVLSLLYDYATSHLTAYLADFNADRNGGPWINHRLVFQPLGDFGTPQVFMLGAEPKALSPFRQLVGQLMQVEAGKVRYWSFNFASPPSASRWTQSDWFVGDALRMTEECERLAGSWLANCPSPLVPAPVAWPNRSRLPFFPDEIMNLDRGLLGELKNRLTAVHAHGAQSGRDFISVVTWFDREASRIVPRVRVKRMLPTADGVLTLDDENSLTHWQVPGPDETLEISKMAPAALIAAIEERLARSISASERKALVARYAADVGGGREVAGATQR